MFVMPERQNPLNQLLEGLTEAAGPYLQQRKAGKSQSAILETLSSLGEDATPMQFTRALYSNPNIRPEDREAAAKTYFNLQTAGAKQTAAERPLGNRAGAAEGKRTPGQLQKYAAHRAEAFRYGETPMSEAEFFGDSSSGQPETQETSLQEEPTQRIDDQSQNRLNQRAPSDGAQIQPNPRIPLEERSPTEFIPPYKGKPLAEWKTQTRKENDKIFDEAVKKNRSRKEESVAMGILSDINDTGKLPEGLALAMIDPETGDLRDTAKILVGANPETQRWVKTIAERITGIKDTFGARVTNFDAVSFMRKYPSLMNTQEGRRQLIEQIELVGKLNNLHNEALIKIYNKYKLDGIPKEDAEREAEEIIGPETEKIKAAIAQIGKEAAQTPGQTFKGLPDAKDFKEGNVLNNKKTGKAAYIIRNGKWEAV